MTLVPQVRKAAWDRQGQQILVYKEDESLASVAVTDGGTIRLWSLPVGKLGVWDIAWSPDGRRVAVSRSISTGSDLRVWDARTGQGERVLAGHQEQVYAVAWSTDNKRLASASQDGTIRVWDSGHRRQRAHAGGPCRPGTGCGVEPRRRAARHRRAGPNRSYLGRPNRTHDDCPRRRRRKGQRCRLAS